MQPTTSSNLSRTRSRLGLAIILLAGLSIGTLRLTLFDSFHANDASTVNLPLYGAKPSLPPVIPGPTATALGPFSPTDVRSCNIEHINGENFDVDKTVSADTRVALDGWVADAVNRSSPSDLWIELTAGSPGTDFVAPVHFRFQRPDVRDALGGERHYTLLGYMLNLDTTPMPAGRYHLLVIFRHGTTYYRCDNGRYLNVTAEHREEPKTSMGMH